jgi:hypothetical protein
MKNFIFLVLFLSASLIGRTQSMSSVVKSQALEMGKAFVAGDSKLFSKFMLPELIEVGGGEDKVNVTMDSMFMIFKSFGGQVQRITYGNPGKIVKYKKELQTTLPQTTEITSPFADVVLTSTLIALSRDNGKSWFFFDTSMGRAKNLREKLPTLSPEIVVPPMQPPKITPKQEIPQ